MAEAAALSAAALGVETFEYNRQNYMYDRDQRLVKEFKEMGFRVEQAGQWRDDVRDIVGLQEKKSKTYCLVAVITLGFSMSLWCQGRLPIGTPSWVMLGNQVAAGGGFTFLTMVIWLGMYASVSAQGYLTRLLTQLVRLPVPSWQEIESCRTYGSSFEKLEGRQMFRVPFLLGAQEGLVTKEDPTPSIMSSDTSAGRIGAADELGGAESPDRVATDPWGLEARRDDTYELGCPYGADCARLRHIKLTRHAALFWQSYDAFARISLSIGINQVVLGLSYFILGNMCISLKAPVAAFAGVYGLICCSKAILNLDIQMPMWQSVIVNLLLVAGPLFACIACYQISGPRGPTTADEVRARFFAFAAFMSHGLFSICLCIFCGVSETKAGDFVPRSYRAVLWSDVFGWVYRHTGEEFDAHATDRHLHRDLSSYGDCPEQCSSSFRSKAASKQDKAAVLTQQREQAQQADITGYNPYAMEYMESAKSSDFIGDCNLEETDVKCDCTNPALQTVSYDEQTGDSRPIRYEDYEPLGAASDMRNVHGAPRHWHSLNAQSQATDFFNASSFMPRKLQTEQEEVGHIVSGHDRERPGILPWKVYRNAAVLLGLVWILAGVYQILDALQIVTWFDFPNQRLPGILKPSGPHTTQHAAKMKAGAVVPAPSFMQLWKTSMTGVPHGPAPEKLVMSLPIANMELRGLSCDADALHFAVTDGLSTLVADLQGSIDFQDLESCTDLLGEALDDTLVTCGRDSGACEVLVLHRNGNRMTACPVEKVGSKGGAGQVAEVSQQWLQRDHEVEQVASMMGTFTCEGGEDTSTLGCISVSTTRGRVAHLRHSRGKLLPATVLPQDAQTRGHQGAWQPGAARAFNDRYLGILQPERSSIQVLDTSHDLADAGTLILPVQVAVGAFCVGGGYVYFLSEGPNPHMWRLALPASLTA